MRKPRWRGGWGGWNGGYSPYYYNGTYYGNYGYGSMPSYPGGYSYYPNYYSNYGYSPYNYSNSYYYSPGYSYYTPGTTYYTPGYSNYTPGYSYYSWPRYYAPETESRNSAYSEPNSATVTILVSNPDAEIWFDDTRTTQRGMERTYQTARLQNAGTYLIKARWNENGRTVERERQVNVQPGQSVTVDFRDGEKIAPRNEKAEKVGEPRP